MILKSTGFQLLWYATKFFALLAQQKTTCIPQKADKPLLFIKKPLPFEGRGWGW